MSAPDDTEHENEMLTVASLFREAVQVTPPSDEVVSMVALPDELLQHIFDALVSLRGPRSSDHHTLSFAWPHWVYW